MSWERWTAASGPVSRPSLSCFFDDLHDGFRAEQTFRALISRTFHGRAGLTPNVEVELVR